MAEYGIEHQYGNQDVFNTDAGMLTPLSMKATDVICSIEPTNTAITKRRDSSDNISDPFKMGLLATEVNIQYDVPVKHVYEVTSQACEFVCGHPQGKCTLKHVVGPTTVAWGVYSILGDVAQIPYNNIRLTYKFATCNQSVIHAPFTLKYVSLVSYNYIVTSETMQITDTVFLDFLLLDMARDPISTIASKV